MIDRGHRRSRKGGVKCRIKKMTFKSRRSWDWKKRDVMGMEADTFLGRGMRH